MASYNKKIVAFTMVIALCSGAMVVHSAQSAADECTKPVSDTSGSLLDTQPNLILVSDDNLNTSELLFKIMLTVLFIIILGAVAIYISKKFLPRITSLSGKKIRISETVHLGPRKAVHLIKIGKQTLLIGSTNENITKLADVTDALAETDLSSKSTNDT